MRMRATQLNHHFRQVLLERPCRTPTALWFAVHSRPIPPGATWGMLVAGNHPECDNWYQEG
eukprot:10106206-Prorocentrum_lima.AAC.1